MSPNLSLSRARKARLSNHLPAGGSKMFGIASLVLLLGAVATYNTFSHIVSAALLAGASLCYMLAAWIAYDLSKIEPNGNSLDGRLSREALAILSPANIATPRSLWQALTSHWHVRFLCNHLFIAPELVSQHLPESNTLEEIWQKATELADQANSRSIEPGHIAMALMLTSPELIRTLQHFKLSPEDLAAVGLWLDRGLAAMNLPKPTFGGIGRDWANGFTPQLNHFGQNLSLAIEKHGAHYGSLVDNPGVTDIKTAFSQGATAIALVGQDGVGKTEHAHALAQNILAETHDRQLEHNQIVSLSPAAIISAARGPGELEFIVHTLFGEAAHAGHVIIFMDDAQLFFKNGPGSFDATQILLPIVQSRSVRMIFAMTPNDYQLLKSSNSALAGLLTPVIIQEPDEQIILEAIQDAATQFEIRHKLLITYQAIKETYRLSGRYEQDIAYPGKAIRLLEQSLTHADNGVVNERSVQQAIEQTTGVKASSATPVEADQLLNLEDLIHERMINQSHAVSVVANALRRARAGVANPKRPIGSFLFLGPTGVGKTELSKAIAATYFRDESNMIRLDMSEFQQESDVSRLLSSGAGETSSLILKVRQQPFSVVLLDEIEKAHPNILNLLLQLLDEGQLTDTNGRAVSFKDCVVICTSNAGADSIRNHIEQGEELESFEQELTDELIESGQFKPELLNRFDEIVLFRPLNPEELAQVVRLMLQEVNQTLAVQKISVELTDAAIAYIVDKGNDPRLGARPMRRALQRAVEDTIAQKILRHEANPGDHVVLDVSDLAK